MTERTLMNQTRSEYEDDAVSITSSHSEQYDSDQEFLVERVLAEKKGEDGKMYFLIFWANYPEEKSTWEPKKNIQDSEILQAWKQRKDQEDRGLQPKYNIARFNARLEELAQAKEDRRRRRKNKRRRLGIPVSPDPEEPCRADDGDLAEAVESNGAPEDYPGIKRKPKAVQKAKKSSRPFVQGESSDIEPLPRRASIERDSYESDGAGRSDDSFIEDLKTKAEKKKTKKQALESIRNKKAAQAPSKIVGGKDKPGPKKSVVKSPSTRRMSSSSSDIPLAHITQQRQRAQHQQHSESTDSVIPRQLASATKGSPRPVTVTSPAIPSTFGHPAGRGDSAGRGRRATRGGAVLGPKNVFISSGTTKKRRSIIENSTDASKGPKHYSNMHIRYRAEKAGRELADAAPDISALGGLFAPSNPLSFQPLKPADLRRSFKPTQDLGTMDVDDLFVSQNSPGISGPDPWAHTPDVLNSARTYSPPALAPTRPQWQEHIHGRDAICRFWHTRGTCSKGYECDWKHTNDAHLPIGPAPPGHSSRNNPSTQTTANQDGSSTQTSRYQWQEQAGYVCHFWHMKGSCIKGEECTYKHTNDDDLPIAPAPPGHHCNCKPPDEPPASHYSPPAYTPSFQCSPTEAPAHAALPIRPPWDRRDPYNAICVWYHKGNCKEGTKCRYLHTDDIRLPIGPNGYVANETCKYWAEGHCQKPDNQCLYIHGYSDPAPEHPNSKWQPETSASSSVRDEAANYRPVPRKSVSFAIDEPMVFPDEPENINPPEVVPTKRPLADAPFRDPKYNRTCVFWINRDCYRGDTCRYWHTYDGSDKQVEQPPGSNDRGPDTAPFKGIQGVEEDIYTGHIYPDHLSHLQAEGTPSSLRNEHPPNNAQTLETGYGFQTQADSSDRPQQSGKKFSRRQAQLDASDISSPIQTTAETAPLKLRHGSTRISMDSYRQKKVMKALGDRGKEVAFGKDETKFVVVDFGDLSSIKQHPWGLSFAALAKLHFTQSCLAQDFKAQIGSLIRQTLWQGSMEALTDQDQEALNIVEKAWEQLRLSSAGLVSVCADFVVLVYPAIEEWQFIERSANFSSEMRLRYLVFETNLDLGTPPDTSVKDNPTNHRKTLIKAVHALNFKSFVPKLKPGQKYHFYLLFPSTANKIANFITNWLRANSNQCKIYSSQTEGAWDIFAKDPKVDNGNILIHESAITTVCELPSLIGLIAPTSVAPKTINFWYISEGANEYPMYGPPEGSSPGQISATRLLPHGHAFFLTPSFLVAEPKRACHIIEWFWKEKLRKSTPGTWKLLCAHNIRQYLLDIAIEKSAEKDQLEIDLQGKPSKDAEMLTKGLDYATCRLRFQMHALITELLSQQTSENYSDYESDLPDEFTSPVIYAHQDIDPDDEQALVTWFAGWAMCKLDQFRKFTVVGTAPSDKTEKQAVRKKQVVALRAQSPKLDETIIFSSPKLKEQSKSDLPKEHKRPAPPRTDKRLKNHPTISASEPSNFVTAPVKPFDNGSTKLSVSTEKLQALAVDSDHDHTVARHGIDAQVSLPTLEFIGSTGANLETTQLYLSRSDEDVNRTLHLYQSEAGSAPNLDSKPLPSDFIGPAFDGQPILSPAQSDGAGDEQPRSSGANSVSSARSGIQSDENGRRFVSTSVQLSGTARPELSVQPGYVPSEDRDAYLAPHGRLTHRVSHDSNNSSRNVSAAGSHALHAASNIEKDVDMDIGNSSVKQNTAARDMVEESRSVSPSIQEDEFDILTKEIKFEATTVWYGRLYKEGKGWEHVYVESWEKAFKYLQVK